MCGKKSGVLPPIELGRACRLFFVRAIPQHGANFVIYNFGIALVEMLLRREDASHFRRVKLVVATTSAAGQSGLAPRGFVTELVPAGDPDFFYFFREVSGINSLHPICSQVIDCEQFIASSGDCRFAFQESSI